MRQKEKKYLLAIPNQEGKNNEFECSLLGSADDVLSALEGYTFKFLTHEKDERVSILSVRDENKTENEMCYFLISLTDAEYGCLSCADENVVQTFVKNALVPSEQKN